MYWGIGKRHNVNGPRRRPTTHCCGCCFCERVNQLQVSRGPNDMKIKHIHSPFLAKAVGATKPDASETRHRATSTTNALKAMILIRRSWKSLENAVDIGKAKLTVGREESRKQEGANNEARLLSFCMSAIFHNKSRTRYFAIFEKRRVFETVILNVSRFQPPLRNAYSYDTRIGILQPSSIIRHCPVRQQVPVAKSLPVKASSWRSIEGCVFFPNAE